MKSSQLFFLALIFLTACHRPQYFAQKGNYDKAIEGYSSNLRYQKKNKKSSKDLSGLESTFALAQRRDSAELVFLTTSGKPENWPRINALHRQIKTRQENISDLQPLRSRKGYAPQFAMVEAIDSLQDDSRRRAAAYLYAHAQDLLGITESTGQRQPARAAYYALRDLKTNYFPYWENANALIDSAYLAGKAHILFETSVQNGVSDGDTFWENASLGSSFVKNEWLIFYKDSAAREQFDYRAKCRLVSLYVGSENTSQSERTETKQVEDGFDEIRDTSGQVISRTQKYKTETTVITTYYSSRSASGSVILEVVDEHTRKLLSSQALQSGYDFSESSETFAPSAPTYWGMIQHVAGSVEWDMKRQLRKVLVGE